MTQTVMVETETGESLQDLARRHGLASSGKLPGLLTYARQLWAFRHFITTYASARVSNSLGTTYLGIVWQVLTPLFNAAVYYVIFGVILNQKAGTSTGAYIAYLCCGVFIYNFTGASLSNGGSSVVSNLGLIRALQFPRAALPISIAIVELRNLIASMAVLITIVLCVGEPLTWEWFAVIPALALQTVFNLGLAMFFGRLVHKIIDIKQLIPFLMRIWMYMSAVLYPVQRFTDHLHGWKLHVLEANPLLVYIELIRFALLEDVKLAGTPKLLWVEAAAWAIGVFFIGFVFFWRGEKGYGRG
jgi:teichoic acid transport system permease protein